MEFKFTANEVPFLAKPIKNKNHHWKFHICTYPTPSSAHTGSGSNMVKDTCLSLRWKWWIKQLDNLTVQTSKRKEIDVLSGTPLVVQMGGLKVCRRAWVIWYWQFEPYLWTIYWQACLGNISKRIRSTSPPFQTGPNFIRTASLECSNGCIGSSYASSTVKKYCCDMVLWENQQCKGPSS